MEDILLYAAIVVGGFLLIKIISTPLRLVMKFVINGVCGLCLLLFFNILSPIFGVTIDITFWNVVIAAILGLPGVIILALAKIFL